MLTKCVIDITESSKTTFFYCLIEIKWFESINPDYWYP